MARDFYKDGVDFASLALQSADFAKLSVQHIQLFSSILTNIDQSEAEPPIGFYRPRRCQVNHDNERYPIAPIDVQLSDN